MSDALAKELLAAARVDVTTTPLIQSVRSGSCSRDLLRDYLLQIMARAVAFPRMLGAMLALCDDRAVRHSLLANLLEEEGGALRDGQLTFDPSRSHAEMARHMCRAAGATEEQMAGAHSEPSRWLRSRLEDGDWMSPFAYLAVGMEANVPATFASLVGPLREHYGFGEDSLRFLLEHLDADARHGEEGAALVARLAEGDARPERLFEGARRGGQSWLLLHRSMGRLA